ncbi:MAG: hypothetical protein NZ519_03135 [Bacteroidia bacterium]|nr:hypothetical protein [Bacteroidia bacterium]MDW8300876.1 hypothetical protein [Bacteroidia bacterium]
MATISYISPKSFFVRISEIFQNKVQQIFNTFNESEISNETSTAENSIPSNSYYWGLAINEQPKPTLKPKLSVSIQDLKIISTALLHYRKELAKKGRFERADEVSEIDKRIYDLIMALEERKPFTQALK